VTVVCITNCKFFFAQSDAEVRKASSRYSELETNSPAACVPLAMVPAVETTNWPVFELSNLVTIPKSSITSPCGPNLACQARPAGPCSRIIGSPFSSTKAKWRFDVICIVHRLLKAPTTTAGELRRSANEYWLPILT